MVRTVEFDEFMKRRAELLATIEEGDICIQQDDETIAWMITGSEYERLQGTLGQDAADALKSFRAAVQSEDGRGQEPIAAETVFARRAS
jgi:hypothetical protein